MITYKDKTYCHLSSCAAKDGCPRFMTPDEEAKAILWTREVWPSAPEGIMLAAFYTDEPECYVEI